jgi:hypothetical protein
LLKTKLIKIKKRRKKRLTSSLKEGKMIVSSICISVAAKTIKRENPIAEFLQIAVVVAAEASDDLVE